MENRIKHKNLYFSDKTCLQVKNAIEAVYDIRARIRVYFGDTDTGKVWLEQCDISGTIGRSTGDIKVPLLIANSRSRGGPALLDHCIVGIQVIESRRWLYKHTSFNVPILTIQTPENHHEGLPYSVVKSDNNEVQANFSTREKAQRYIDFMYGLRMRA